MEGVLSKVLTVIDQLEDGEQAEGQELLKRWKGLHSQLSEWKSTTAQRKTYSSLLRA